MKRLIGNSLKVTRGVRAFAPQYNASEEIDTSWIGIEHEKSYCSNNGIVAYVYEGTFYVTPWTGEVDKILSDNGFTRRDFFVPFSNSEYPEDAALKSKWDSLKVAAERKINEEFRKECIKEADEKGIGEIAPEFLNQCLAIPYTGLKIRSFCGEEDMVFPLNNGHFLDSNTAQKFCKYSYNNGVIIFVYRNGVTYLCKNSNIVDELDKAGYERRNMYVPLSNGEEFVDSRLQNYWAS